MTCSAKVEWLTMADASNMAVSHPTSESSKPGGARLAASRAFPKRDECQQKVTVFFILNNPTCDKNAPTSSASCCQVCWYDCNILAKKWHTLSYVDILRRLSHPLNHLSSHLQAAPKTRRPSSWNQSPRRLGEHVSIGVLFVCIFESRANNTGGTGK